MTTLESLGVDVDDWISRKKRNETDVILKFKGKSLTKAAEFAINKRNEDGSFTDMIPTALRQADQNVLDNAAAQARPEPLCDALAIQMDRHSMPKDAFNCETTGSKTISMRSTGKTLARQKLGFNREVVLYDD